MKNITVELVIEPSVDPRALVGGLARLTQVKKEFATTSIERGSRIIDSIATMGHTSLLEPLRFGFIIHGASRVFLAQITRHRMATYVSQSQQYQNHSGFPFVTIPNLTEEQLIRYNALMALTEEVYTGFIEEGVPQDQARYVIPGAAANDLFVELNARELIEAIIPQRICRRNTLETRHIMSLILNLLTPRYDYLFKHAGPACVTAGKCNQGKMACGNPFKSHEELLDYENI